MGNPTHAVTFTVDVAQRVREDPRSLLGININYWLDKDERRQSGARSLAVALQDMGVNHLRYPGGDKSDGNLWSIPPFDEPNPVLAVTGPTEWPSNDERLVRNLSEWAYPPMDFDEFMTVCHKVGAQPTLVVCYDAMYGPVMEGHTKPTRAELLEAAVAWVHYANVVKGYQVKNWEIGNESYIKGRNNRLGVCAKDYARDFIDFATAMKAADNTIQVGANGPNGMYAIGDRDRDEETGVVWWEEVLKTAGHAIDFLAIHPYPCWKWMTYDFYYTEEIKGELALTYAADEALRALRTWCPNRADSIWLSVTEVNSADWWGHPKQLGWSHRSSLGHGLVLFDILGQFLCVPKVKNMMVWNTRWLKEHGPEIWDALDERNQLLPTGQALALWTRYLKDQLVSAKPSETSLSFQGFASYSPESKAHSLFLLNKSLETTECVVQTNAPLFEGATGKVVIWQGKGPDDETPEIREGGMVTVGSDTTVKVTLPPVSLTIIDFEKRPIKNLH